MEAEENQHGVMIDELKALNASVRRQNAVWHIFMTGVIYGLGFFIGSAILATIVFGLLAPEIGKIEWVRETFERGNAVR